MNRKILSLLLALFLIFSLCATAFAADYDVVEKTHGTHANPGKTVYSYSENGKTVTKTETEEGLSCPMVKFTDLYPDIWCHEGLDFVLTKGYMLGTSETEFSPDGSMTRAMIVTVLYRIAKDIGLNAINSGTLPFDDTPKGAWYYDALCWAYKNNIAKGFSANSFAPNMTVTREQITLFISRFAKLIGDNTSDIGDISGFSDVSALTSESKNAIAWAVAKGVLNGYGNGEIRPKNTATRAHFASMLQRWMDGRCTEHDYVLKESNDAGCSADGSKIYVCSICGAERIIRLPATGHSYGEKQTGKAASCTEEGTYVKKCLKCGDEITVDTIPVTEHSYVEKITPPTCTSTGEKLKICSGCGKTLTEEIPKTAHNYVDGKCTDCGREEHTAAKITDVVDGDKIVIYNPNSGLCLGEKQEGIGLGTVSVSAGENEISIEDTAAVLSAEVAENGVYLKNSDGDYLTCLITDDGAKLCFSSEKNKNALWIIDGSNIINVQGVNTQYLECYNDFFMCYHMTSNTDNFVMELYKVS